MSAPLESYPKSRQKTSPSKEKSSDLRKISVTDLLAEQAAIVHRLAEITAQLTGQPTPTFPERRPPLPDDFSWPAYAIGLLFEQPDMSARELAKRVGVTHGALYNSQRWSRVAKFLRAREAGKVSERRERFASLDEF